MKKINWIIVLVLLVGFVIGAFLGTFFKDTFLNYGQSFGLASPVVLDLGFVVLTLGLQIHITISSVIGAVLSLVVYKFISK